MIVSHDRIIARARARIPVEVKDHYRANEVLVGLHYLWQYCEAGDRNYVRQSCRGERAIVADAAREIADANHIEH